MDQLVHIAEAVLPDALRHDGGSLRQRQQCSHQRLHIRGEAGVRHSLELERLKLAGARDTQRVVEFLHLAAGRAQLGGDGLHVLRDNVVQRDVPLRDSGGHHIAAGLDLVGNDGVVAAVHLLDAVDLDDVGTGAVYVCTHHIQEIGQIDNVRLTGHVFKNRRAFGQDSGQHGVHRGTDGDRVKKDVSADQMLRPDVDLAVLHGILCTKGGEGFQVLVNRARAQIAAARHGDLTGTKAAQQCAEKVVACSHLA